MKEVFSVESTGKERNNEELSKELRELVVKMEKELSPKEGELLCKVDIECPSGYVCAFGKCVKKTI